MKLMWLVVLLSCIWKELDEVVIDGILGGKDL